MFICQPLSALICTDKVMNGHFHVQFSAFLPPTFTSPCTPFIHPLSFSRQHQFSSTITLSLRLVIDHMEILLENKLKEWQLLREFQTCCFSFPFVLRSYLCTCITSGPVYRQLSSCVSVACVRFNELVKYNKETTTGGMRDIV